MKERTLFGKPNAGRQEAVGAGLALLTGDAVAAGRAAASSTTMATRPGTPSRR